ncbi:NAD(P)/FAD-dependent oxidoreductase [Microbacterium sp. Marseille-Q6965]|uniref:phytoene desaturase family protein n=1 Tax=Microbacterium sp. Marseille-Q6965 TaxID=2965072 RepID=UPI0021B7AF6D|nr:NAD(P)/FAD-dependent oxidoreductase [Microbacterium sp. Marseille-Q6965]
MPDAIVVGAGPNGLAAAVILARAGLAVEVHERAEAVGGAVRTREADGFRYDVGAAVHPMALGSPFFRSFGLADRIDFAVPEISYAHPLPDGRTGVAFRSLDATAGALGGDGGAWRRALGPLVKRIDAVSDASGGVLLPRPGALGGFATIALAAAPHVLGLTGALFRDDVAPALLAGAFAHGFARIPRVPSVGAGLVLAAHAHARGWPIPRGGSQAIADALAADLVAHGGVIRTGSPVDDVRALPPARAILLDLVPRDVLRVAGARLPERYARTLRRWRHGPAAFKVDYALSRPIPWRDDAARRAGTVHLGGTLGDIRRAEAAVVSGRMPERPFILLAQPSLFDPGRAPVGRHTAWAYAHVPHGWKGDATPVIDAAIEEHAPGFRDTVLARISTGPAALEAMDHNLVGGDISGGAMTTFQTLARPVAGYAPWRSPVPGLYLCSSSTAPGGGVHGMGGWNAARLALRDVFGLEMPELGP